MAGDANTSPAAGKRAIPGGDPVVAPAMWTASMGARSTRVMVSPS